VALHLLIAAHVTHFLVAGRTLSPVEPSESMYTLEIGQLNAGFVFFAAALLATLVFGRFVCGWGCHIVALQDLCGWIMKRLGVRPRPFRSRLLLWVPLGVALYMFVWPQVKRLALLPLLARAWPAALELFRPVPVFPGFTNHLLTDGFWDTFPGPLFAALTFLTCGFAAVYFLGAKGFCTYGCPYGALFVIADRFSPGRIVVDDRCEQCGHCTATCTSNVLVHEEVRRYGMVVDPGCMKCMDCVSVCPKGALSFAFARPAALKGPPRELAQRPAYTRPLGQEVLLLAVCVGATLAFRGLYDGPPLLMAVGLGGVTAFLALELWQLIRRPAVRLQNLTLKLEGRMRAGGWFFAAAAAAWLLFAAHSGFVQWHRKWGTFHLARTEVSRADGLSGAFAGRRYSERHERSLRRAGRHLALADRWGLARVADVELGLAWVHLLDGDVDAAVQRIRQAIVRAPEAIPPRVDLVELLLARGRLREAAQALQDKIAVTGETAPELFRLATLLAEQGRSEEAVTTFEACLRLAPGSAEAHYNLGGLLRRMGRVTEAIEHLDAAAAAGSPDADTHVELGLAHQARGDRAAAIDAFRRAIELDPDSAESRVYLPRLIEELER
jgi:tetratricopeptide (TPR) repeat protein/ferredoxin